VYVCLVEVVDAQTSHLLVATLCFSLLIIIMVLLPCLLYLIYKRVRVITVKSSLTAVVTHLPPLTNNDFSSDLRDVSSGYSGSGSGVLSTVTVVLFGLEVCPLTKTDLRSLDFVINTFFYEIF